MVCMSLPTYRVIQPQYNAYQRLMQSAYFDAVEKESIAKDSIIDLQAAAIDTCGKTKALQAKRITGLEAALASERRKRPRRALWAAGGAAIAIAAKFLLQ